MAMGVVGDIAGFQMMTALKESLVDEDLRFEEFILSMGTSGDYEEAI